MDEQKGSEINRGDEELDGSFEFDDLDELEGEKLKFGRRNRLRERPLGEQPHVFLKRWRRRSAFRRIKLVEELLLSPLGTRRLQKLELLLQSLETKRLWLENRLGHTLGLKAIVEAAIERQSRNRRGDRRNEGRGNNRREGGNQGGGQP
jgi:hypothetical protein